MTMHIVPGGYVDIEIRPQAVPVARYKAIFAASADGAAARGESEASALGALATEMRRIASAIDELARNAAKAEQPPLGNFKCDVCNSKLRGPIGYPCPFEHYPQGHAVEVMS